MKRVVTRQKFERTYAKWCGCEWGSNTFFNVIAPVATTKPSPALSAGKAEVLLKAQQIGNRITQIVEAVKDASDWAAEKTFPIQATGPVAEYVENIHKALDQYATINNLMSLLSDNAVANIERRVNQLGNEVSQLERASPAINQPMWTANASANFSAGVSYAFANARMNGVKSVSTAVQAITDGGKEISVFEASSAVWHVQLECKNGAQCVRWDGGESPGFEGSNEDRNSREIEIVFKSEAEARSFAHRFHQTGELGTASAANMHAYPNSSTTSPNATRQPSTSTKVRQDEGRKVYTIQVGVFTSKSKAEAMMSQLETKRYDAPFIDAISSGTGPYHVRVGRLPDLHAAQDLRKRLAADGFDTFITTLNE